MSSNDLRNKLLGISTYMPPETLQDNTQFQSAADYSSFLSDTRSDPGSFWMKTAHSLNWETAPTDPGSTGDWFTNGRLDIEKNCFAGSKDINQSLISTFNIDASKVTHHTQLDLANRVDAVAAKINEWKLSPGDRVLIAVTKDEEALAAIIACLKLGLTCVPMDPSRSKDRIPRRAKEANCEGAIVDPDGRLAKKLDLRNILEFTDDLEVSKVEPITVGPMHPAFVLADSAGQLFSLPLAGFLVQAVSAYKFLLNGKDDGEITWLMMPSHYASFLSVAFGSLICGGRLGTIPITACNSVSLLVEVLGVIKPKILIADVKTIKNAVESAMTDGVRPRSPGPEVLVIDGEIVEPRVWTYLRQGLFDGKTHVVQMLSRPESGGIVAGPNIAVTPVRSSSVSLPAPGVDLTVIHTDGTPCEAGEGGLLALNKAIPGMALELQELEPPLTIEVKARRDQADYIWPMGEFKLERTKAKGVTIPEVEAMIVSIKGVEMAAIIRHMDPNGTNKTRAFIQPSDDATQGLLERVKQQITDQFGTDGLADRFQMVKHLPYGRTGKLLRSVLRRFSQGEPLSTDDIGLISDEDAVRELTPK